MGEVEDARALAGPGAALAGERHNVKIDGFDYGNSPRENGDSSATITVYLTREETAALKATSGRYALKITRSSDSTIRTVFEGTINVVAHLDRAPRDRNRSFSRPSHARRRSETIRTGGASKNSG